MFKNTKYLFLLFILALFFQEFIFRLLVTKNIFTLDFIVSLLFLTPYSILFFVMSSFKKRKLNYIASIVLLSFAGLIFSSQFIYYKFFKTFYSMYSAGNATQVLDFWKDILLLIAKNSFWILLFYIPVVFLVFFGKKLLYFKPINWQIRAILLGCMITVHFIAVGIVLLGGKEQHSSYDLYFNSRYPELSAERFGMVTTMRLDVQRMLVGWTPKLEEPPAEPVFSPTPKEENTSEDNEPESGTEAEKPELEPQEEPVEYNEMDIDFDRLIENEDNDTMKALHKYFKNVEPTTKNEYTGKFEGYNLVLITAEGFSPYAVHEKATPTLYKMVNEGYKFTNFYNPFWEVSTTDGEYVALQSLIPKSGVWSFEESADNYLPFVMGNQLKDLGYKTKAYHNHTYDYYRRDLTHPNMGYEYKGIGNGLDVQKIWPASDLEMMQKTVDEYVNDEPFHAYYMTVSGHMQYSFTGNNMALKNKDVVQDLPYSEQAKAYIATQVELDRALEHLLAKLDEAGVADNTLIALSADHYPYGLEKETIDEFSGHEVEENFELYKSPFVLYSKGIEPKTIDKPSSSLDIIPTLSNLLGLEFDSRLLMGKDIFSDARPVIPFLNKSFITDKGKYNAITKKFTPNDDVEVDQDYIDYIKTVVDSMFYYSNQILDQDYYRAVLDEN